ncbi:MAG: hypothetical protein K8I82_16625, partial [Anaerolineae bacterium]|nr:hypothetical protein [Anaerolineae bacterium]
ISHFSVSEVMRPQAVNADAMLLMSWNDTTLNLWKLQTGEIQHRIPLEAFIYDAWWEAGHSVVALTEGQIVVWDVLTNSIVYTFPFDSATTAVSAWDVENKVILTWTDHTILDLWNLETGEKVQSFVHDTAVNTAAFRHGRILTTDANGEVRLWEKESPSPVAAIQVGSSLYGADVNRDGTRILTWTIDGKIDLWTLSGESVWGQQVRTFALEVVMWNRDETRLIATTFESGIFIWDDQEVLLYHLPYEGTMYVPVLSPDESRLLAWAYGRADLWPLNIEELLALATYQGGRELTREERGQFFLPPEATPEPEG